MQLTNKRIGNFGVIAGIFFIAGIGSGIMYSATYLLPLSDNLVSYGVVSLAITVLGLAVPFFILKLILHEAHLRKGGERPLRFSDIPKDRDQLDVN